MIASPPVIQLTRPRKHVTLKRLSFDYLLLKRNFSFLLTCIEYLAHHMSVSLKVDDTTMKPTSLYMYINVYIKKIINVYKYKYISAKKYIHNYKINTREVLCLQYFYHIS